MAASAFNGGLQDPTGAFDPRVVDAVAYGIAKVIATATVEDTPGLRNLDALGKVAAAHTAALNMVPQLQAEALAAIGAFLRAAEAEAP